MLFRFFEHKTATDVTSMKISHQLS